MMLNHEPGTPAIIIGRTESAWSTATVDRVTATLIHLDTGLKVVRKTGRTRSQSEAAPRLVFKGDPEWDETVRQWNAILSRRSVRFWGKSLMERPDDIDVIDGAIRRLTEIRDRMAARQ